MLSSVEHEKCFISSGPGHLASPMINLSKIVSMAVREWFGTEDK